MPTTAAEGDDGGAGGPRDPERFYCPFPGCNRSFAELWRLKVHYRAPPDIRGSGKERGHGTELTHCPKCSKALKPGKHHVGCSGSKVAPRQTTKRARPVRARARGRAGGRGDGEGGHNAPWPGAGARRRRLPLSSPLGAFIRRVVAPFLKSAPWA